MEGEHTMAEQQETGRQVRETAREVGVQVRETVRQVPDIPEKVEIETLGVFVEHLEDTIRTKPLQSVLLAAGAGLLIALLWKR
jgi:ElaB/YqjD/DUF883 family membrane-anchored ribosome-binding protein